MNELMKQIGNIVFAVRSPMLRKKFLAGLGRRFQNKSIFED